MNQLTRIFPDDWRQFLQKECASAHFLHLSEKVEEAYRYHQCYPPYEQLFEAFSYCRLNKTKVVILGQDPYHGPSQAHGLSFSVPLGVKHPPSLKNIFKEIEEDLQLAYPISGDLTRWADQGVLLLNAVLSVEAKKAGSHGDMGWQWFTDRVISRLSDDREGLVFMLWGGFARKKAKLVDNTKHLVLETGHPSPLSANRGYWFGNKHFSQANDFLVEQHKASIDWS